MKAQSYFPNISVRKKLSKMVQYTKHTYRNNFLNETESNHIVSIISWAIMEIPRFNLFSKIGLYLLNYSFRNKKLIGMRPTRSFFYKHQYFSAQPQKMLRGCLKVKTTRHLFYNLVPGWYNLLPDGAQKGYLSYTNNCNKNFVSSGLVLLIF